jgi:hypothetical protein
VKLAVGLWAQGAEFSVCALLPRHARTGKKIRHPLQTWNTAILAARSDPHCFLFATDNFPTLHYVSHKD